jgi:hypothetical protein
MNCGFFFTAAVNRPRVSTTRLCEPGGIAFAETRMMRRRMNIKDVYRTAPLLLE